MSYLNLLRPTFTPFLATYTTTCTDTAIQVIWYDYKIGRRIDSGMRNEYDDHRRNLIRNQMQIDYKLKTINGRRAARAKLQAEVDTVNSWKLYKGFRTRQSRNVFASLDLYQSIVVKTKCWSYQQTFVPVNHTHQSPWTRMRNTPKIIFDRRGGKRYVVFPWLSK